MARPNASPRMRGKQLRRECSRKTTPTQKRPLGEFVKNRIYRVDALEGLKRLPDDAIDCVVTSPPYWATRDYGVAKTTWPDGSDSALGLEKDFTVYIEHLCLFFDEVRRVLKPTGTCWINLGDTYAGSGGGYSKGGNAGSAAPDKSQSSSWPRPAYDRFDGRPPASFRQSVRQRSLCQIPARFAIAMCERGWILRNDIVWHKPNHMPESVKNRFTCSWEHLFLFVKQPKYHFDLDAVRIPHQSNGYRLFRPVRDVRIRQSPHPGGVRRCPNPGEPHSAHPLGKNPADVWRIGTVPSKLEHFAVFPEKLIERPILAGCPAKVCKRCGTPKLTRKAFSPAAAHGKITASTKAGAQYGATQDIEVSGCGCKKGCEPGIVLDPFMGAGTTAVVARRFERRFLGFELNANYVGTANARLIMVESKEKSNSQRHGTTSEKTKDRRKVY